MLIHNLDIKSVDDINKCQTVGAEIAAALMSNRYPNDSNKSTSSTVYTPYTNSSSNSSSTSAIVSTVPSTTLPSSINSQFDSTDSIFQILSACKCLYVSHRKIAIYLQNLQELEKKNLQSKKKFL